MHIASCSFGKDSIATIIIAHENNEPLDEIVYCEVMFDRSISGELPEHKEFIQSRAIPTFEKWGYKVTVLHSENTYIDLFNRMVSRSNIESRNGKKRGFPMGKGCHMNSGAKIPPIRKYWKAKKDDVTQYVGIAIDEPMRLDRVVQSENQVSLLQKYGYTEEMAKQKCIDYDLLSPIYQFTNRGGCWFCPNQTKNELRHLRKYHRELWDKLLEMSKEELANPYFNAFRKSTVQDIENMFLQEEQQMTIFDYLKNAEK